MARADERLRALREELKRRLADRLPDGATPLADLRELQDRLKLVDAQLATHDRWRRLAWPAVVVAAALSAVALVPVPRVPFTLDAHAAQVRLHVAEAATLPGELLAGDWRIEGYARLESPDATLAERAADGALGLRGAVRLQSLSLPAHSVLQVAASGRTLRVVAEAPAGPVAVALQMSGRIELAAHDRRWHADYPWSERLRLLAGDAGQAGRAPSPVELTIERSDDRALRWVVLPLDAVDFTERQPGEAAGTARYTSSLRDAKLVLPATGGDVSLAAGDGIVLSGLRLERGEVTAGSDVTVRLSGSASTLETQVGSFRRSLKPSLLEWLARHHTLELLWSAAGLLWGAAAWWRRQTEGG